ncbi:PQQ-binding-like beta-propeller repeat protein [Haladaptatus sp. AB618]|uniref:outer membrane protein assembly factor BamB family protein n=1 Tax=Haladaptatus sp. AB618 TaxID=2934173 RepID=UPI00209BE760|nr:PQQ-binding-like beta-propeller repeat protein [Haladaptatus sp. AB618]MCO8252714.1 PQQ-binding-like beta-propeller repeat protein [Haladaptatus sp. AB618]
MPEDSRRTFLKTVGLATGAATVSGTGMVLAQQNDDSSESSDESGGDDATGHGGGWTTFRGDSARTGATDASGPSPYATTDWSMDIDGTTRLGGRSTNDVDRSQIEPVFADGTMYLGVKTDTGTYASDGYVVAYDPDTGDELWKQTDMGAPDTPTVSDGTLYFATETPGNNYKERGALYALDASDGSILWKRDDHFQWANPLVANGRVYTAYGHFSNDSGTVALDPKSGETAWENTDVYTDEVSYADGILYARTGTALNADDGTVLWNRELSSLEAVSDGIVYGSRERDGEPGFDILAYAAADGEEKWNTSFDIESDDQISNVVVGEGGVYVLTYAGYPDGANDHQKLHAIDAKTGDIDWTYRTLAFTYGDPTLADGTVYFGGKFTPASEPDPGPPAHYKTVVYAVDAASGERKWTYMMDGDRIRTSSTPVVRDGKLYVSTYELDGEYAKYVSSQLFVLESTDEAPDADHRIANDKVVDPNEQPTAHIESSPDLDSCTLEAGDEVTLDGSNSTDDDGVVSYKWDTDGDGTFDATGETVTVTVPRCGSVKVTLEVSDGYNADKASVTISAN